MLWALVLLLLQTDDSPATAPKRKAMAQQLLDEGTALYEGGDAASALRKFNAAYAVFPSPKLWFNIAQSLRDLGRPVEALDAYERFIEGTDDVSTDVQSEALHALAELRGELAGWILQCQPTAEQLVIDGRSLGRPPLLRPIWMTPGRHVVELRTTGYLPFIVAVHANAGQITRWPVSLVRAQAAMAPPAAEHPALPSSAAPHAAEPAIYERWPFWAVIGGAVLVGGLTLAVAK